MKFFPARFRQKLLKGGFVQSILLIASGSTLGQLLVIAASPLLTRLYTPEQFGVLGVYMASIILLSGVFTLRYELAIPLPEDDVTAKRLLQIALLLSVGFAAALILILFWRGDAILDFIQLDILVPYATFLPLGALLIASYQSFTYWAVRKGRYLAIATTKLWQGLGNVVTQIVLGLLGLGTLGLLAGDVVGRSAGISRLAREAPGLFKCSDLRELLAVARRYKKFPIWSTGSTFINRLGLQLPQFFLASFFSSREAGWYLLVQRVLGAPVSLLGQAVSQVFLNQIAQIRRERPDQALAFYIRMIKYMFLVGGLPIFLGGVALGNYFGILFGPDWDTAGQLMQALSLMYAAQWTFSPTSQVLIVFEKQEIQLTWDTFRISMLIAAIYIAMHVDGQLMTVTKAISFSMTISYLTLGAVNIIVLRSVR